MDRNTKIIALAVVIVAIIIVAAFALRGGFSEKQVLKISTTTSLEDTGLLTELESVFEQKHPNIDVQFIAVGTGQALKYGKSGDVSLVMVHAKSQEEEFIKEGYGTKRVVFAYNYFYIVGPASDPAKINGTSAVQAFDNIRISGTADPDLVKFVSRGDNSGTNTREIKIWNSTGVNYNETIQGQPWYVESGKGMGDTLNMANQLSAYTLSDSGTYLAFEGKINLVPLVTKGKDLLNIYSLIPVNASKFQNINAQAANEWLVFVTSSEGQEIIGKYGIDKYGQQLFIPLAGKPEPTS